MKNIHLFSLIIILLYHSLILGQNTENNNKLASKVFAYGFGHDYGVLGIKISFLSDDQRKSYGLGLGFFGISPHFLYRFSKNNNSFYSNLGTLIGVYKNIFIKPYFCIGFQHWPRKKIKRWLNPLRAIKHKDGYFNFGFVFFPTPKEIIKLHNYKGISVLITIGIGFEI